MGSSRKKLTVKITGICDDRISADAVISVIQETVDALKDVGRVVSERGKANIEWHIVSISMQSPLEAVFMGTDELTDRQESQSPIAIESWMSGLRRLESSAECPPGFTTKSLKSISHIQRFFAKQIRKVEYREDDEEYLPLTDEIFHNAKIANSQVRRSTETRTDYVDHGSIEGVLTTLSTSSGSDKIVISESLDSHDVPCFFSDKAIEEKARNAWKRRVIVTGSITYSGETGEPVNVNVEGIRVMPAEVELPRLDVLEPVDITNGVESSEYVRRIRDGI
jgi:hypothetical protein